MHNYGAVLQAAALHYIIQSLGHQPIHIDFIGSRPVSVKSRIGKILNIFGLRKNHNVRPTKNVEAFENFRKSFVPRTKLIKTPDEFSRISLKFDAVVVGSDQVWRPEFARDPIAFFLGYVPEGVRRVAYAASFGTPTWCYENDLQLTNRIKFELGLFAAISCREDSAVEICKNIFNVEAEHVLDPLLLVNQEFLTRIIANNKSHSNAGLVFYKLDIDSNFLVGLREVEKHFKTPSVNMMSKKENDSHFREVEEWLSLLYSCEIVITDSFHCICLALRFGKRVVYCPNDIKGKARIDSLFRQFNIDAVEMNLRTPNTFYILNSRSDVVDKINEFRTSSTRFLSRALT